jgi:ribosome-binding factor A
MESTRQQKVARLIQKELAEFMRTSSRNFGPGVLISVTVVRVSPDLGLAKVYLSVFPSEKSSEVVEQVQNQSKTIRYDLGTIVKNQLRTIPELHFYIDDSLDYAERIDELLKK